VKRSRRLESGVLPRMPDILLLRIFRVLAPANYCPRGGLLDSDSTKDLLNLEIVCHDMIDCLRRSSHLALYPHIPATIPGSYIPQSFSVPHRDSQACGIKAKIWRIRSVTTGLQWMPESSSSITEHCAASMMHSVLLSLASHSSARVRSSNG
jgi:hypothetical protein